MTHRSVPRAFRKAGALQHLPGARRDIQIGSRVIVQPHTIERPIWVESLMHDPLVVFHWAETPTVDVRENRSATVAAVTAENGGNSSPVSPAIRSQAPFGRSAHRQAGRATSADADHSPMEIGSVHRSDQ